MVRPITRLPSTWADLRWSESAGWHDWYKLLPAISVMLTLLTLPTLQNTHILAIHKMKMKQNIRRKYVTENSPFLPWHACLPPPAVVPDRVQYKIAVLVFCRVHLTTSPTYLDADLSVLLAPIVRQCLRLSWQPSPTNRAFPVVGPRTSNDRLPDDVTSAESLSTFRQRLKTFLFTKFFSCLDLI